MSCELFGSNLKLMSCSSVPSPCGGRNDVLRSERCSHRETSLRRSVYQVRSLARRSRYFPTASVPFGSNESSKQNVSIEVNAVYGGQVSVAGNLDSGNATNTGSSVPRALRAGFVDNHHGDLSTLAVSQHQIKRKPLPVISRPQSLVSVQSSSQEGSNVSPVEGHTDRSSWASSESASLYRITQAILDPHVKAIQEQSRLMHARSFLEWISIDYPLSDFYTDGRAHVNTGNLKKDLSLYMACYDPEAFAAKDTDMHRRMVVIHSCLGEFLKTDTLLPPATSMLAAPADNRRNTISASPRPTVAQEAWRTLKFQILGQKRKFRESQNWRGNLQPEDRLVVEHPEPVRIGE